MMKFLVLTISILMTLAVTTSALAQETEEKGDTSGAAYEGEYTDLPIYPGAPLGYTEASETEASYASSADVTATLGDRNDPNTAYDKAREARKASGSKSGGDQ